MIRDAIDDLARDVLGQIEHLRVCDHEAAAVILGEEQWRNIQTAAYHRGLVNFIPFIYAKPVYLAREVCGPLTVSLNVLAQLQGTGLIRPA